MKISYKRIATWMNVIRDTQGQQQYSVLENFWESQLKSKVWLIETLQQLNIIPSKNVYIFGGWYGVLAQLIVDTFADVEKVYSIDTDDNCRYYGTLLSDNDYKIHFHTANMRHFIEYENPTLIINTSTEHVDENVFAAWMKNVPTDIPVVLQGNDFFLCNDHIRCSNDLEQFKEMNPLSKYFFEGKIYCPGNFYRFMTIGKK